MQDTLAPASGTPRDASTVVLLRDARHGLEVFLMKRSGLSDTFGEAYVFPGGKLDAHDSSAAALAALDEPAPALALRLGASREVTLNDDKGHHHVYRHARPVALQ